MRGRIRNWGVRAAALLVAMGLGMGVAPAASRQVSSIWAPTAAEASTPRPSATGTSSGGSKCANVHLFTSPVGASVGLLCTTVTRSGTRISGVAITFTASSRCTGNVILRVSGSDQAHAEFADVKTVACGSGTAMASFTPVSAVASNSYLCGLLMSDTYSATQACVSIIHRVATRPSAAAIKSAAARI